MSATETAREGGSSEADVGPGGLKRTLGPVMLWGLGVGYVISGEYFGWNLGLPLGGTVGMLVATLFITVMYLGFVFAYAELACAMPRAGGVFVYATRALGRFPGFLGGWAQLIEFVFAPPAIAMAIGAYAQQRYPEVDPRLVAAAAYLVFTSLNIWGVKQAALFELVVTVLAVGELLLFMAVSGPSFSTSAFMEDALPHGVGGVFACLPFAIWFFLAIEGVANAAEEARDPERTVARGFGSAIVTLVVLALGVFFTSTGVAGWRAIVFAPGSKDPSDAPLPLALAHVVGTDSALYTLLLGVGLLGLIASFHGIILAAGRATMELGRASYLPAALGKVNARTHTPVAALVANLVVGIIAILSGRTASIITLAAFGAVTLYIIALVAFFRLRKDAPELERPFHAVGYPWLPALALGIAVVSALAMAWNEREVGLVYAILLGLGAGYFAVVKSRLNDDAEPR